MGGPSAEPFQGGDAAGSFQPAPGAGGSGCGWQCYRTRNSVAALALDDVITLVTTGRDLSAGTDVAVQVFDDIITLVTRGRDLSAGTDVAVQEFDVITVVTRGRDHSAGTDVAALVAPDVAIGD